MSNLIATEYQGFEQIKANQTHRRSGNEFWLVRELAPILEYSKWENFKKVINYKLSRYACYLIVQNGDPRKEIIA